MFGAHGINSPRIGKNTFLAGLLNDTDKERTKNFFDFMNLLGIRFRLALRVIKN